MAPLHRSFAGAPVSAPPDGSSAYNSPMQLAWESGGRRRRTSRNDLQRQGRSSWSFGAVLRPGRRQGPQHGGGTDRIA
ncbi:unnamed protein product [Merluccius merluccius]